MPSSQASSGQVPPSAKAFGSVALACSTRTESRRDTGGSADESLKARMPQRLEHWASWIPWLPWIPNNGVQMNSLGRAG